MRTKYIINVWQEQKRICLWRCSRSIVRSFAGVCLAFAQVGNGCGVHTFLALPDCVAGRVVADEIAWPSCRNRHFTYPSFVWSRSCDDRVVNGVAQQLSCPWHRDDINVYVPVSAYGYVDNGRVFQRDNAFRTFVCMLGALAGVWLACSELTIGSSSIRGAVWVMLAALAYAIYVVFINRRPIKSVATLSQTFWTLISGMAVLAVAVCVCGLDLPGGWFEWGAVVLLALVPTLLTFLATSAAVERVGIVRTAELGVFEPVTSVVFGIFLFDERFSLRLLIAALLVLVCVTMVIANGNLTRQVLAIRKLFPVFRRHQHRGGHRH